MSNYYLKINRWVNERLEQEIREFEYYEDVFQHIDNLLEFDNVKVTNMFDVIIHEQKFIPKEVRPPLPFNDAPCDIDDSYA